MTNQIGKRRQFMLERNIQSVDGTQVTERPTLLLIADSELIPKLAQVLGAHHYTIYVATEITLAQTLLFTFEVDLVLLHFSPEQREQTWEAYTVLRQATTKPVILIPTSTIDYLVKQTESSPHAGARVDLRDYLQSVNFLCRTLIPKLSIQIERSQR
jgi:hypothetical protein